MNDITPNELALALIKEDCETYSELIDGEAVGMYLLSRL